MLNHVGEWQAIRDYKLMETQYFGTKSNVSNHRYSLIAAKKYELFESLSTIQP